MLPCEGCPTRGVCKIEQAQIHPNQVVREAAHLAQVIFDMGMPPAEDRGPQSKAPVYDSNGNELGIPRECCNKKAATAAYIVGYTTEAVQEAEQTPQALQSFPADGTIVSHN